MNYKTIKYANLSKSQVMDLYLPDQSVYNHRIIVLIHGGAFLFCDQKMERIRPVIEAALNKGYSVASLDYRKSDEAKFPGCLADCKAAIRYLKAHHEEYGFDPDKMIAWGESAGAYLSLMCALTPEVKELNGDIEDHMEYSSSLKGFVAFYPPVEFYTMKKEYESWGDFKHGEGRFESMYLGVEDIYKDKEKCYESYWETYKDHIPSGPLSAWIQVGDENDTMVPYKQSENLAGRLSETENITVHYEQKKNAKHEDDAFYTNENLNKILNDIEMIF